jgi:hypothetical protein
VAAIRGCDLVQKKCCMQHKRCIISISDVTLQCQGIPFGPKWAMHAERGLCAVQSVRAEIQVLQRGVITGSCQKRGSALASGIIGMKAPSN